MFAIGFIPALGLAAGGLGALGSIFGGRGSEKRARRYEGEALEGGRRAGKRSREAFAPEGRIESARQGYYRAETPADFRRYASMLGQSAQATANRIRPEFERGLTESIGQVVGGLGRRGGMVGDVVGRAGERFTDTISDRVGTDMGLLANLQAGRAGRGLQMYGLESGLARQDEDVFLSILGELAGAEQGRANAARRGWGGLAGLGFGTAALFG